MTPEQYLAGAALCKLCGVNPPMVKRRRRRTRRLSYELVPCEMCVNCYERELWYADERDK